MLAGAVAPVVAVTGLAVAEQPVEIGKIKNWARCRELPRAERRLSGGLLRVAAEQQAPGRAAAFDGLPDPWRQMIRRWWPCSMPTTTVPPPAVAPAVVATWLQP